MVEQRSDASVVVVGAGLAGLTAASELRRHGIDVLVLEAADRPGGRAFAETSPPGSRLDLGGQWLGHDHHRVAALAAELGVTPFPMETSALALPSVIDGTRRVSLLSPSLLVASLVLLGVGALSQVGTPRRWNSATVDSWLQRVPGRTARRLLEVIASISWTADLDRFSVHAMAEMIRSQGGLRTILSTKGGAQEFLLIEGAGALVDGLVAELGDRVVTGRPVVAISREEGGVTLRTAAGDVRADRVVVTVPPPMAARIAHDPPLPPDRAELEQGTYMGSVYKAIAVYERPFWRSRPGRECIVLSKPGCAVFDTTAPGGPGHLCVLVGGPEARELDRLDVAARRDAILGPLSSHLGPEVTTPTSWHEKSWHQDEFAGGGYVALPKPGFFGGLATMSARPVGNVHWAGSETAAHHPGYLDGAVESGQRVALEVRRTLSGNSVGAVT